MSLSLKAVIGSVKVHLILFWYYKGNNKFNEITCKGEIPINPGALNNNLEYYKIKGTTMGKDHCFWLYESNYIVL